MEEFKINLDNLKVDQLGFVFKDIEKQAKIFENILNIPKFALIPEFNNVVKYRGKDSNVRTKICLSHQFGIQFELIEHIEGDCLYKEFLDQGREGLHHISLFVDELEPNIEYFKGKGYDVVYSGSIGKQNWVYFDTEETLGMFLEIQETKKRRKKTN
ncbi:MAG: VOC family protein [Candidatus Lokiarchaeota archaeon]|nr:VOC family protein [Candidatus Lokiarchaeota archaeon]